MRFVCFVKETDSNDDKHLEYLTSDYKYIRYPELSVFRTFVLLSWHSLLLSLNSSVLSVDGN